MNSAGMKQALVATVREYLKGQMYYRKARHRCKGKRGMRVSEGQNCGQKEGY